MARRAGNSQGDELPAIIYLRLALHLNPEHPLALITLADIFERLKSLERANEVFSRIPDNSPVRATADVQIGLNLEQMGKGDEAISHLEDLAKRRPDDIEVITSLGNVLRSRKRYAEAAEAIRRRSRRSARPNAATGSCSTTAAAPMSARSSGTRPRRTSRRRSNSCRTSSRAARRRF
jgi:tetratricopeptide (TPR) repeat protein